MKRLIIVLILVSFGLSVPLMAQYTPVEFKETTWQGVMDGDPGEGALFFRLEFENSDTVKITKQFAGQNHCERHEYRVTDSILTITYADESVITNFRDANLTITDRNTILYKKGNKIFHINRWSSVETALFWIGMLIALIILNELFRRYKWPTIVFYFLLPVVLIPLWSSHGVTYWFKWVKLYSVVFACIWFTLIRYTKLGNKNYAKFIAAAFLAVNIMEAVMQDFSMGFWANILNAIGGILSIITLSGYKHINADNSKYKDMIWPAMTVFWIIAYDIWNFVFVYLNFPGSAANQFLVLLSCTIPSLFIKKGTWLQARAFTLAAWFMLYFTVPLFIESHLVPLPRTDVLMFIAGFISFAANGAYAIVHFRKKLINR
jgi:hypothetical protein